jgi:hypothetical protein
MAQAWHLNNVHCMDGFWIGLGWLTDRAGFPEKTLMRNSSSKVEVIFGPYNGNKVFAIAIAHISLASTFSAVEASHPVNIIAEARC